MAQIIQFNQFNQKFGAKYTPSANRSANQNHQTQSKKSKNPYKVVITDNGHRISLIPSNLPLYNPPGAA